MVGRRSTLKTVRQYAVEQRRDQRSKVLRGKGGIADQQTRHRRDHADRREVRHRIEWQPRIEGRVDLMADALIACSERDAPC
jgi:hypothetical protein